MHRSGDGASEEEDPATASITELKRTGVVDPGVRERSRRSCPKCWQLGFAGLIASALHTATCDALGDDLLDTLAKARNNKRTLNFFLRRMLDGSRVISTNEKRVPARTKK